MDNNKKNLIVTLSDQNFVNQAKQLFSSVYFKAGWEGDYLLLACGIPENDLVWFRDKGIIIYDQPLLADSLLGVMSYPPIVLSKFYLFQEYFKQWNKIVFLDADIIVRGSLNYLLGLDGLNAPKIKTFWLKDEFFRDNAKINELEEKCTFRGRPFSTGVMALETGLINSRTFDELMHLYYNYKDLYQYQEESTLNLYFYNRWKPLPLIYNLIPSELTRLYGLSMNKVLAYIIHFPCAKIKPWNSSSPYYEEWLANFKRAEDIDLNNRIEQANVFSNGKIFWYYQYLKYRKIVMLPNVIRNLFLFLDRQIGRLGLLIKKKNIKLYNLISFKNEKR